MKVSPSNAITILSLVTLIGFSSCKKIIDDIIKHPSNGVASDCRIDKIIGPTSLTHIVSGIEVVYSDTAYFTYTAAGNPKQIKHSITSIDPYEYRANAVFKYDSKNRLIAYLKGYRRNIAAGVDETEFWIVYRYNPDKSITATYYGDGSASFSSGDAYESIKTEPDNIEGQFTYIYTLDEYGRIKSTKSDAGRLTFHQYDANGNLVGPDFIYSDNLSYLQTNKVWMFIKNDFSVNARTSPLDFYNGSDYPDAFNSKKLPTHFSVYPSIAGYRADEDVRESTVIYQCK